MRLVITMMTIDPNKAGFTKDDKDACLPIINRLIELNRKVIQGGALAIRPDTIDEQNVFLKTALTLIQDGVDPSVIKSILTTIIWSDDRRGAELLERLIILEGASSIQHGENPMITSTKLFAYLGEGYLDKLDDINPKLEPQVPHDALSRLSSQSYATDVWNNETKE